ncbi:MAG TPA: sensor histidine kinase [Clostridium sp.]|uniref:sensor histidine kinase n=1 Tax=Clostridium sp. TaxID=1506 RepID=UPI000E881E25|nr:sensor histidine kinase [Clostridium sp.]
MSDKKPLYKIIFKIVKILFSFSKVIFKFLYDITEDIAWRILEKFRFSLTFKITVTYVFTFILVFSLIGVCIIAAFKYYMGRGINNDYISVLTGIMFIAYSVALAITTIVVSKASKKFLSPVEKMTNTVREISINDLNKRLNIKGSKNELKDLAKTFNEMLDRIESSVKQQNQFVSDASHELRTPISVIQGYANLLHRWGKDDREILEESICAIKSESENMKDLIEKLLFLARGDKKAQKVEKEEFILGELIEELIKETKLVHKDHHIESEHNEKFSVYADRKLIKEALRVFMDNSIKYTKEGGIIKLDCYFAEDINAAVITVADTGIGISKEHIPHIFERFYRADESRTKSSGGTGLGLSIAKWILDIHKGKIDVWSELDIGTVMKITFPVK